MMDPFQWLITFLEANTTFPKFLLLVFVGTAMTVGAAVVSNALTQAAKKNKRVLFGAGIVALGVGARMWASPGLGNLLLVVGGVALAWGPIMGIWGWVVDTLVPWRGD